VTIRLMLDGKPLDLRPLPPNVAKIKAFLDAQPDDQLFSGIQLAEHTGICSKATREADYFAHEALSGYSEKLGLKRCFGNPRAIQALIQTIAKASRES
jgi:hypothetical protein